MIGFGRSEPSPALSGCQIVLSGVQPTGEIHIGNYFGAIKNFVQLQEKYRCIYFIADYHAITVEHEPTLLSQRTLDLAKDFLACGIDPERSILFVQSHIPEHTELAWILSCVTSYGDLSRMTQFKEKGERQGFVSAGLFNYPVLQAADILIYKAQKVPVGRDQVQHIELTRRIARRFNSRFGEFFPEPEPLLTEAASIKSTNDPAKEMSKSLGPKHYIGLMEPEEVIREKIKKAVTDVGPRALGAQPQQKSPGVANLFLLLKLTAPPNIYDAFEAEYAKGTLKYEKLKEAVFEHLMQELQPIRERRKQLKESQVRDILQEGAAKAREIAQQTLKEARKRIGV